MTHPQEQEQRAREVLEEARRQLVYMDERSPSGTTPAVIAQIDHFLANSERLAPSGDVERGVVDRVLHVLGVAADYATTEQNGGEFSEAHRKDLASMNGDVIADDRRLLAAALSAPSGGLRESDESFLQRVATGDHDGPGGKRAAPLAGEGAVERMLVPCEPTEAMLWAGSKQAPYAPLKLVRDIWSAMLAAGALTPTTVDTPATREEASLSPDVIDAQAETYRMMHDIAVNDLGYPSILEALEAAPKATREEGREG